LDASVDSISESSRFKLVAVIARIEWVLPPFRLGFSQRIPFIENFEVNTVMIYLACSSFIISQSVFESDLKKRVLAENSSD